MAGLLTIGNRRAILLLSRDNSHSHPEPMPLPTSRPDDARPTADSVRVTYRDSGNDADLEELFGSDEPWRYVVSWPGEVLVGDAFVERYPALNPVARTDGARHTPTPWMLTRFPGVVLGGPSLGTGANGNPIYAQVALAVGEESISADEREANARLIAAAPDLLATLKTVLPLVGFETMTDDDLRREDSLGNGYAAPILAARAIIAAATGEASK